jgi:hypothetical protein
MGLTLGIPTAAPSPLPSPIVTPPLDGIYFAVPIPTLSAATTYSVGYTYPLYTGHPGACYKQTTVNLGAFVTQ